MADLDAGSTGAMAGGGYPDLIRPILDAHFAGDRTSAMEQYARCLPLINFENRQSGLLTAKVLMKEGSIIDCDLGRHPLPEIHPTTRAGLLEIARTLNAKVFNGPNEYARRRRLAREHAEEALLCPAQRLLTKEALQRFQPRANTRLRHRHTLA